ncbi:MAG: ATP-binding protein [Solirubrobacteraceae bacterium]
MSVPTDTVNEARESAVGLFAACGGSPEARGLALLSFAADLLCAVAVDLAADRPRAQRLIDCLETRTDIRRAALGRELLRAGRLLELPVELAIEVHLALLKVFTGADTVSLWTQPPPGKLTRVSHVGELDGTAAHLRATAAAVLRSEAVHTGGPAATVAVKIESVPSPAAALVAHGADSDPAVCTVLLEAAVPIMAALLDRRALLARERSQETVVDTVERRLARLRFDLHDGPQQDVHLLAQDLSLFRDQLRPMIAADPNRDRALGRLDDLEAQLVALDGDLRRLSTSVQSPFLAPGSLQEALAELTDAFAGRTGIVPETKVTGAPREMTDSQQIAVLSLVREALSNIRKHSDAEQVRIEIKSEASGLTVEICDDGKGFDPEATLVRAARAGRLGLVGMHERVRMLGGRTQIDSRPGGPTVISANLPAWHAETTTAAQSTSGPADTSL